MKTPRPLLQLFNQVFLVFLLLSSYDQTGPLAAYPISFTDAGGHSITIPQKPQKAISLVPSLTEMIYRLGAGDCLEGGTYHDAQEGGSKVIVGGFLTPSLAQVSSVDPEVIFLTPLHREVRKHYSGGRCLLVDLDSRSLADLYRNVETLGLIFDRRSQAEAIVREIQQQMAMIAEKVKKIPPERHRRVMRIMGRDQLMTPGEDSFQNEFIRAAGGIPPRFGKNGGAIPVTLEEWQRFNPQVIYGCGGDRVMADRLLTQPGWRDVEAVRTGSIHYFPCALTCRASVHAGDFVSWLATTIYEEEFASETTRVFQDRRIRTTSLGLPLTYIRSARVDETRISDFPHKTLIVEFKEPMRVTSTLEGERSGILNAGNHYTPPPCWGLAHRLGLEGSRKLIYKALGKSPETSSFLFTGADMGNLSVQKAEFKAMTVYALVTAGVESNALRMAVDEGRFYEPGTINVMLMTNMRLSSRARTRAIITATEAKTAALQDLDIRSSASSQHCQATGTGTDEILIVEGRGRPIDHTGGHCKMGELIARAVYEGVKEAVFRQNGITTRRNIFRRLQERRVDLHGLLSQCDCAANPVVSTESLSRLEELLLQPRYAAFVETAFALSDAFERGQIKDLALLQAWCRSMAEEIAGTRIKIWTDHLTTPDIPLVLRMSLNALLNGLIVAED